MESPSDAIEVGHPAGTSAAATGTAPSTVAVNAAATAALTPRIIPMPSPPTRGSSPGTSGELNPGEPAGTRHRGHLLGAAPDRTVGGPRHRGAHERFGDCVSGGTSARRR